VLFLNDDIKTALNMSKRVEQLAFALLENVCFESSNVKKALAKSILSVFDHIRAISEASASSLIEKLRTFPDDSISEIAPLIIYFAEFRKDSFIDWRWRFQGLYDDLQPFDDVKFKTILREVMLKNSESRAAFSWEFVRLTDGARRKIKHSLDYDEAFSISIRYLKELIGEYDHGAYDHIYRFIEDNMEQPSKFDFCYELWIDCLKREKNALASLVQSGKAGEVYWWPHYYNGKILLFTKQHKGDDVFLEIFKLLVEYPKEVNVGDVVGCVDILKKFPKSDERVGYIFSKLIERNSNYFHDKQIWEKS
jgi:hypothetical protein